MQPYYTEGLYRCRVIGQAMGESSKGNPQFSLRFKVLEEVGEDGEAVPVRQQYDRTHYRSITEKTASWFAQDLRALGYPHDSFRLLDQNATGAFSFDGAVVEMVCAHKPDQNGEMREQWSVASGGTPAPMKPLQPQKLRELDNLFGKHLSALPAPKPAQKPASAPAPIDGTLVITDDDIPF